MSSRDDECKQRKQELEAAKQDLNEATQEISRLKNVTQPGLEWLAQQLYKPMEAQAKEFLRSFESQISGKELNKNEYEFVSSEEGRNMFKRRISLKNCSGVSWHKIKLVVQATDGRVWILEYPHEILPNKSIEFPKEEERTVRVWVQRISDSD